MKLSEAMMLGSTTVKMVRFDIRSCALGAAANAIGIPFRSGIRGLRGLLIAEKWPWIKDRYTARNPWSTYGSHIAQEFNDRVCGGQISFEALVDHVRSIEPECGECNRFECTCALEQEDAELKRDGMSTTLDSSNEPQLTAEQHLYEWYEESSALGRLHPRNGTRS